MGKRRAKRTPKGGKNNKKNAASKKSEAVNSGARMHMLHSGPNLPPRMEELMRKAIERPSKETLSLPVMDAIQRQMGNQFAVTLIQRAMADDNSDYTSLRVEFDPDYQPQHSSSDKSE